MKDTRITKFLMGLSAVAILIGLVLLGLAFGASVSTGNSVSKHALSLPALGCLCSGALTYMMIFVTGSSHRRNEDS